MSRVSFTEISRIPRIMRPKATGSRKNQYDKRHTARREIKPYFNIKYIKRDRVKKFSGELIRYLEICCRCQMVRSSLIIHNYRDNSSAGKAPNLKV